MTDPTKPRAMWTRLPAGTGGPPGEVSPYFTGQPAILIIPPEGVEPGARVRRRYASGPWGVLADHLTLDGRVRVDWPGRLPTAHDASDLEAAPDETHEIPGLGKYRLADVVERCRELERVEGFDE